MTGTTIEHYQISEKLGEGGMGVVYKAYDTRLERHVALKFLPAHAVMNENGKERFIQEARAAGRLNHPGICTIYQTGAHEGNPFIAMELVEGGTLRDMINRDLADITPADLQKTIALAIQIADALAEAHDKGIIHRDIKPDNIMMDSRNRIKVMDFGLAKVKDSLKLTQTSATIGTIAYMSPEQIQGTNVDHRTDIFSFGILFYEMLSGQLPFRGEHQTAMMYSISNEDPIPIESLIPDIPAQLIPIVNRLLEKDPGVRYGSFKSVRDDLQGLLISLTGPALRDTSAATKTPEAPPSTKKATAPTAATKSAPATDHTNNPATTEMDTRVHSSRTGFIVAMAAMLLLTILLIYTFIPGSADVTANGGNRSIAVLPLENLSPNPDDAYFTDGVHEDIIVQLTKIEDLKVIARSSVTAYRPGERNMRSIGSELGVSTVMEGSVRRSGDQIRVAVQLIDLATNRAVWAETFDRNMADLFTIQSDIAREIASALRINLRASERELIERRPTVSSEAYELYLQAREYYNRPGYTNANLTSAAQLFERAVEADESFALAHAHLSVLYSTRYWFGIDRSMATRQRARLNADRAYSLQPDLAEALYARGMYEYWLDGDYEKALSTLGSALKLQPNNTDIISSTGAIQRRMGRWEQSVETIEKAIELNPRVPNNMYQLVLTHRFLRNYDQAIYWLDRIIALAPDFFMARVEKLAVELDKTGNIDQYRNALGDFRYLNNTNPQAWWYVNLVAGNVDYLLELWPQLNFEVFENQDSYHPVDFVAAMLLMSKGEIDRAGPLLQNALQLANEKLAQNSADPRIHAALGRIYGLLNRRDDALYHGRRAMELMPASKDVLLGVIYERDMAAIYSFLNDAPNSVKLLDDLLKKPSPITVTWLRHFPEFEFIRDTPEFQDLLARHSR
jgi:eukaryotic-like serine/threonine-protein kinase